MPRTFYIPLWISLFAMLIVGCRGASLSPIDALQGTHLYGLNYVEHPENATEINQVLITCDVNDEPGTIRFYTFIFLDDTATMIDETGRQLIFQQEDANVYTRRNTPSDLSRLTLHTDGYHLMTEVNNKPCVEYQFTLIDDDTLAAR